MARVDARLFVSSRRFDFELGPTRIHRFGHAAHGFHFMDDFQGFIGHVLGQLFHHVAARPRVDDTGDVRFFLNDQLRVARDAGAELCGQGNGFVKAIGVQRLGATKNSRHGFHRGSHNVVIGVLFGERPARGLAMRSEHPAFGIFRAKALHDLAPNQPGRPHLGDLQVEVHPDGPEKRQSTGKRIHIQALGHGGLHILFAVGQGEGQFQSLVGPGFLHVITRDGYRVEFGHVLRRVSNDVPNDAHARLRRIDIGVAHHELFEDVVLNRPAELIWLDALLLGGHDITGQHG